MDTPGVEVEFLGGEVAAVVVELAVVPVLPPEDAHEGGRRLEGVKGRKKRGGVPSISTVPQHVTGPQPIEPRGSGVQAAETHLVPVDGAVVAARHGDGRRARVPVYTSLGVGECCG